MDVLLTGGNGLLGRHLVTALHDRGDSVRVLALPAEDTRWLDRRGVAVHRGDILRAETLTVPLSGVQAVFHLAGMMGVWRPVEDYHAVNVTGTENVCRAALAEGVARVVHVSSWTVYGMDLGQPAREEFLLRPFHEPYAVTKAAGDKAVAHGRCPPRSAPRRRMVPDPSPAARIGGTRRRLTLLPMEPNQVGAQPRAVWCRLPVP